MAYVIEVNKRDVSPYAEDHQCPEDEREDCTGECRWLDGDAREIRDHGTSTDEYDPDDAEEYGGPVQWATKWLSGKDFPALYGPQISDGEAHEREWLHGTSPDPYRDEETEYTVYLRGEWTPQERAQVFRAVGC